MSFLLSADTAGFRVFAEPDKVKRCPECRIPTDKWSEAFATKERMKGDLAISFEGIWLASKRFKAMYAEEKLEGVEFRPLGNGHFALLAARRVSTDKEEDGIQYLGPSCASCGSYAELLTGTFKPLLADHERIGDRELVGSIQEYSSRIFRHYWLFVGNEFAAAIHNHGMRKTVLLPMAER